MFIYRLIKLTCAMICFCHIPFSLPQNTDPAAFKALLPDCSVDGEHHTGVFSCVSGRPLPIDWHGRASPARPASLPNHPPAVSLFQPYSSVSSWRGNPAFPGRRTAAEIRCIYGLSAALPDAPPVHLHCGLSMDTSCRRW